MPTRLPIDLSVVVPVHNEQNSIASVLADINSAVHYSPFVANLEVIVVDDGSTDNTARQLSTITWVKVIFNDTCQGYGAAIMQGVQAASNPWICIIDGDSTYSPYDIPRMVKALRHSYLVIARRYNELSSDGFIHTIGRKTVRQFARAVHRFPIQDLNSGLRIFNRSWAKANSHQFPTGFSLTSTMTILSYKQKLGVGYVPVLYHKRSGNSKVKKAQLFFKMLRQIWKLR